MAICTAWGFAVMAGIFVAIATGSKDAHLNPAVTVAFAVITGDASKARHLHPRADPRRLPRRDDRLAALSPALAGDDRRRRQAGLLLHRAGDPRPESQHTERNHRHVRAHFSSSPRSAPRRSARRSPSNPGSRPISSACSSGSSASRSAARRATRSTRRATSGHGSPTPCCRSTERRDRIGVMRPCRSSARSAGAIIAGFFVRTLGI